MRQNRKVQLIILLTLVCIVGTMTIAYAVLSTTLNITGTTDIIASSWNVYFDNIQLNTASVTATKTPTITDSKTIDFSVNLNKPGDFYKFNVDIVNGGSIDAMIDSVVKLPDLNEEQAKFIKYEIEYTDGNAINNKQLLASGETKTISVLLSYRYDITVSDLPTTVTTLDLSITLNYIQADTTGTEVPEGTLVQVKNGDINTIGSEICIEEECFYLINNDGYNVTMLSKYNLYTGNICSASEYSACTPYGEGATGKQDSTMIGYLPSGAPYKGTISFSSTNYWSSSFDTYPTYVYNSNSTLYTPIYNYKEYISKLGVEIIDARLISLEELETLGCILSSNSCSNAPSWVYSTSYWTGTAYDNISVLRIISTGIFKNMYYSENYGLGVRPVIEISLSEF